VPNIWTHIIFAEEATAELDWIPKSDDEKAYLRLGAQGPDPFFYYRFWPWIKEKPAVLVGDKIHHESCGPFLLDMIQAVRNDTNHPLMKAYVIGFVTHHLLDRNAHPYINYRSGNEGRKHQELEFTIDTLWMEEKRGIITWKTPVYKEIDVGPKLNESIEKMMESIVSIHFPELAKKMPPGYVDEAYRDMIKAQKVLSKFAGRKSRFLPHDIGALVFKPIDSHVDFLNRSRTEWIHPTNAHEKFQESFDELYDNGLEEASVILPEMIRYWNTGSADAYETITKALGNISYSTGKDCVLGLENKFFEPIL
jgi:hypothetical protein